MGTATVPDALMFHGDHDLRQGGKGGGGCYCNALLGLMVLGPKQMAKGHDQKKLQKQPHDSAFFNEGKKKPFGGNSAASVAIPFHIRSCTVLPQKQCQMMSPSVTTKRLLLAFIQQG